MSWRTKTRFEQFAEHLELPLAVVRQARHQRGYLYIKKDIWEKGKERHLCYPPPDSGLYLTQQAIKSKCLSDLPLYDQICGYRQGMHNINAAALVAGRPFQAKIDIRAFHPSIRPEHVMSALLQFGVSYSFCRLITQLVTFEGAVPQGAPTSNHVANLVVNMVLSSGVLGFCRMRNVKVINYGDDTAFAGDYPNAVDACKEFAKQAFARFGLEANEKSCGAEHVGGRRLFIGTSTGRPQPDLPRAKFHKYRRQLRALLNEERRVEHLVSSEKMTRSWQGRIAYVARLSQRKARSLTELFHRLCRLRRDKIAAIARAKRLQLESARP